MNDNEAAERFHSSRDRAWRPALGVPFDEGHIAHVSYRPLDQRFLYNQRAYGDFLRPELQEVWGDNNVCIYCLPAGTGRGPAVWCHGLLPDYHSFRGSYGGYAFPLYDRRPTVNGANVSLELLQSLRRAYGEALSSEDIFHGILCLLSASSYSLRFAEDLEDVFPHVPFPTQPAVFMKAARVGAEIRSVETFSREPAQGYRRPDLARLVTQPSGALAAVDYADGGIALCADGSGRITGLPQEVWNFSVSRYRVLPRWLEARIGLPADLALVTELRDICGRIAELIALFAEADIVLDAVLQETLTREALGLAPANEGVDVGRD